MKPGDVLTLDDWPETARASWGKLTVPKVELKLVRVVNSPAHGRCAAGWTDRAADGHWTFWRVLPLPEAPR